MVTGPRSLKSLWGLAGIFIGLPQSESKKNWVKPMVSTKHEMYYNIPCSWMPCGRTCNYATITAKEHLRQQATFDKIHQEFPSTWAWNASPPASLPLNQGQQTQSHPDVGQGPWQFKSIWGGHHVGLRHTSFQLTRKNTKKLLCQLPMLISCFRCSLGVLIEKRQYQNKYPLTRVGAVSYLNWLQLTSPPACRDRTTPVWKDKETEVT